MISVFNYTDYRRFLSDYLADRQAVGKKESFRELCPNMGIKSAGHLSLILNGKVDISAKLAEKIATFCQLSTPQMEYFLHLMAFNQAQTQESKRAAFEKIIDFPQSCIHRVEARHYRYYDKWYHCAVRALLEFVPVKDTFAELAILLEPAIREYEARASVKLLLKLGMIAPDAKGFLRPTNQSIDTGSQAASVGINGFALAMLDKARESMDRFAPNERSLSWLTVGVDKEGYEEILNEARAFRGKVAEIAKRRSANRVYQINIQAFPLSKSFSEQKP